VVSSYLRNYRFLLRTLRFPDIRTCETTDELRRVITDLSKEEAAHHLLVSLEV